jgi:hypothetical protein
MGVAEGAGGQVGDAARTGAASGAPAPVAAFTSAGAGPRGAGARFSTDSGAVVSRASSREGAGAVGAGAVGAGAVGAGAVGAGAVGAGTGSVDGVVAWGAGAAVADSATIGGAAFLEAPTSSIRGTRNNVGGQAPASCWAVARVSRGPPLAGDFGAVMRILSRGHRSDEESLLTGEDPID